LIFILFEIIYFIFFIKLHPWIFSMKIFLHVFVVFIGVFTNIFLPISSFKIKLVENCVSWLNLSPWFNKLQAFYIKLNLKDSPEFTWSPIFKMIFFFLFLKFECFSFKFFFYYVSIGLFDNSNKLECGFLLLFFLIIIVFYINC
jgi:hypothetical protein